MKIGAHVSSAVSLDLSLARAQNIGAQCAQFFIAPPQQWAKTEHSPKEINDYCQKAAETGIGPNFIHGTYLINLATPFTDHLNKSVDWLIYALQLAEQLKVEGVIFHLGSHKGKGFETVGEQIVKAIGTVLSQTVKQTAPKAPYLILENTAGGGGSIGRFSELGWILKQLNHPLLKVCLDTQHAFAAGYDLRTPETVKGVLEEFDFEIGLDKLVCIHANDSKTALASHNDRHENIGEGLIGRSGWKDLVNQPAFKDLPFILEVPGFANTGPDKENITILKSLVTG